MKESKKRENSSTKKKKHGNKSISLDSWDQSDLEFADEKVLERRLHQLKLQLQMAQEETPDSGRSSKHAKKKKKPPSDDSSSDSDSSDSDSSFSSASSSSINKYERKSSSPSEDDRKKRARSPVSKKKVVKESKSSRAAARNDRENNTSKNKKTFSRRKSSPISDKHSSRTRTKRSPSLDKKEVYSRMDTSRWHDKAKEAGRERSKQRENDRDRSRIHGRTERDRSISIQREQRTAARSKERSMKKTVPKPSPLTGRRKESPEPTRSRVSHDATRRTTLFMRKNSPRDERLGRHDDRRLDLKVTRRNHVRAGDIRDVNVRITKEVRDRKEPLIKQLEKPREREPPTKPHREPSPHRNDTRDRSRAAEDRLKERDKRLHERPEPDRNRRNDSRDISDDKFRRNERTVDATRGNSRHVNESVFDRMRNRYNDRRNAENQRFARVDRDRINDTRKDRINDKEPVKNRSVDSNGADRPIRDRRPNVQTAVRARSPYRDRKEPIRSVERRTPVNYERKFSSPTATRKGNVRDDNRIHNKRRSLENDDLQWNKKHKNLNITRSRSRSSEKRKRRRSSQEEWRVIDMTSPVLDDELSDENANKNTENNIQNKLKRPVINKLRNKIRNEENDDNESNRFNKTILTDELSDISDEDFNDVNASNSIRCKKENAVKLDRLQKFDRNNRKSDHKDESEFDKTLDHSKNATNDVDDLINNEKLNDDSNRVDIGKNEPLDSEEETDLFTVSRVSDAIGVDWAELVEESKKKLPDAEQSSKLIRQRWNAVNIFSRIGISQKYAGEEIFEEIRKDLRVVDENEKQNQENSKDETKEEKIFHGIAGIHVCMRDRAMKRRTLFEPYKTAISARKDIVIRRRLCGLPVKNINAQHMIGICHWIV